MGALGVQGQRRRRKILRLGTQRGTQRTALRRVGAAHRALKEAACRANGQSPSPGAVAIPSGRCLRKDVGP